MDGSAWACLSLLTHTAVQLMIPLPPSETGVSHIVLPAHAWYSRDNRKSLFCFALHERTEAQRGQLTCQDSNPGLWYHGTHCLFLTQPSNLASGRREGGTRRKPGAWVRNFKRRWSGASRRSFSCTSVPITSQGLLPSLRCTDPLEHSPSYYGALFLLAHLGHLSWA